ncbi:MAG TPA: hypothetical protein PKX92_10495, partial [Edaphocola sp.]|nr:hypothetical protein [Edaphocola sp.]
LDFQGEVVRLPSQGYDIFGYPFYDDYTYQFHHRWINLQLPVKFNYSFKNSDLSFAYVSGIYFNSFKHYQIKENNSPPTLDFLGSSNSISHQSPDDIRLCADLLFNYTYYFSKFAKKRIGVQGFFSYPLICPIVTSIGKTYSYLSYNIENYEFTTSRRLGVKPISFGLGIVLN